MKENVLNESMKVRFTVDYYVMMKRLKSRNWYSGYYIYQIKTIGHKWVKLKAYGKNYKMPRDVWNDLIMTNRFSVLKVQS
jgi:hypothetical protein